MDNLTTHLSKDQFHSDTDINIKGIILKEMSGFKNIAHEILSTGNLSTSMFQYWQSADGGMGGGGGGGGVLGIFES